MHLLTSVSVAALFLITNNWESIVGRLFIWYTSFIHIADFWDHGLGFETFSYHHADWQAELFRSGGIPNLLSTLADSPNYALNEPLHFWIEFGIVSPILFGFFITLIIIHLIKFREHKSFPIALSNAVIIAFSFVSYVFHNYWIILLFLLNCVMMGALHLQKRRIIFFLLLPIIFVPFICMLLKFKKAVSGWEEALSIPNGIERKNELLKTSFLTLKNNNNFLADYYHFLQEEHPDTAMIFLENNGQFMNGYERAVYWGESSKALGKLDQAIQYYDSAHNIIPSRFLPLLRMMELFKLTNNRENELLVAEKILMMPVKVRSNVSEAAQKAARDVQNGIHKDIKMY